MDLAFIRVDNVDLHICDILIRLKGVLGMVGCRMHWIAQGRSYDKRGACFSTREFGVLTKTIQF
jgi:hypothetical protein